MLKRFKKAGLLFSLLALVWLMVPCGIHCQMLVPSASAQTLPAEKQGCPGCLPSSSRDAVPSLPLSPPVNDDIRSLCVSNSELLKSINPVDWQESIAQGVSQVVGFGAANLPGSDISKHYQRKSLLQFPPGEVSRFIDIRRIYSPHAPPFMD